MLTKNLRLQKCLTVLLLMLLVVSAYARVGGGGGDASTDGEGSGELLEMVLYILILIPFPYNIIIIAFVLLILWLGAKKYKQSSSLNTISRIKQGFVNPKVLEAELSTIPHFKKMDFLKKAEFAFLEVQKAWSQKKMGAVRRFLSDGVYQRFHVQQLMMEKLEQTNVIKKLQLKELNIAYHEREGSTDILHVKMLAEIDDNFTSAKYPKLNQSFKEEFIEFWTFVRRRVDVERDIYFSQSCPNCMAPLPEDMGDACKCPACNTFCNVGEYDWVLSEITQPEEFIELINHIGTRNQLKNEVHQIFGDMALGSVQVLEDRASNAYLQYKVAYALKDFARIRRFSNNTFFEKISQSDHEPFLYNRLYLRDVALSNIYQDDERYYASFSMRCREQKVKISPDGKLTILESTMVTSHDHLVLSLSKENELGAYPVLAHNCSNCGAGVMDTLNINCSFCTSPLNSDKKDWILYDILSGNNYASFRNKFDGGAVSSRKEAKLEAVNFDVRDYVLNNSMVIMMADGVLEESEKEHMMDLAKKLGYDSKKVSELWEISSVNSLAIMMPEDQKSRQKVYNKMKKAAMADGNLHENESAILNEIRTNYQLSDN